MEPTSSLLPPKFNSFKPHYPIPESQKKLAETVEKTKTPFPTTGNKEDELLILAFHNNLIDENARVKDPSFNILFELAEEIRHVAQRLNISHKDSGIQPKNDANLPFLPLDLLPCLFQLRKLLGEETRPEIIGGAVSHLLGADFYVSYVMKRFHFTKEEALNWLDPLLKQIAKIPADIDCRQYVDWDNHASMLDTRELFKLKLSSLICEIVKKENPKNEKIQNLAIKDIKANYYQKLFLVTEPVRFGMARFGTFFGGSPVEYIVVPGKLERPYITFHKSMSIVLVPAHTRHGKPTVALKFDTDSSQSPPILPETVIFQQIAMIMDTVDFKGLDWRGFFSCMAESTRAGYRTLNPQFFDNLWNTASTQEHDLVNNIDWAAKNHLLGRGESKDSEEELLTAFQWNILLYLIDRNEISEEAAKVFLQKQIKSVDSLAFLYDCLQIPVLLLQSKLAWFRLGMWLKMSDGIAEGALSTNYGTLCHRIVCPNSQSVIWTPVDLKNSLKLVHNSLKTETWKFQNERMIFLLLHFASPSDKSHGPLPFALSEFDPWIDSSLCRSLADQLRNKNQPHALALSFNLDLARIKPGAPGVPSGMLKIVPNLLSVYPEYYAKVTTLLISPHTPKSKEMIVSVPSLEKMISKTEWISFLLKREKSLRGVGICVFKEMTAAERSEAAPVILSRIEGCIVEQVSIYNHLDIRSLEAMQDRMKQTILTLLKKKLQIDIDPECYPWLLLMLVLGAGNKNCRLKVNKEHKFMLSVFFEYKHKLIPIIDSDIVKKGLAIFEDPSKQKYCLDICNTLFPSFESASKPQLDDPKDYEQLKIWSQRMMEHPVGSHEYFQGLKIYFMIMKKNQSTVPMALTLLKDYPELHDKIPVVGKYIGEILTVNIDPGSTPLDDLLTHPNPIDRFDWIAALLCHQRKGCQSQGLHLIGGLSEEEQSTAWERSFPKLIEYRSDYIAKAIPLFPSIKITPTTNRTFFLAWIQKIKELNKDSSFKSFCEVLANCSDFKYEKLQPTDGESYLDWITAVEEFIVNPEPKVIPEPPKIETPTLKPAAAKPKGKTKGKKKKKPQNKTIAVIPTVEPKQTTPSELFREASKMAKETNRTKFYNFFMELTFPPEHLRLYTKLLIPSFKVLKLNLQQKINLFIKYQYYEQTAWLSIVDELLQGHLVAHNASVDLLKEEFSEAKEYGKSLWNSPDPAAKEVWTDLVMNIVLRFFDTPHLKILEIADKIYPHIPEQKPLELYENRQRCSKLFIMIVTITQRHGYFNITEAISKDVPRMSQIIESGTAQQFSEMAPMIMVNYWALAYVYPNENPNALLRRFLEKDPSEEKRFFISSIINILSVNATDMRLDTLFEALTLVADDPKLHEMILHSLTNIFGKSSTFIVNLDHFTENSQFLLDFSELVTKLKLDRLDLKDSLIMNDLKFKIFEQLLEELEKPSPTFLSLFMNSVPTNGWLQYLLILVRSIPTNLETFPNAIFVSPGKGVSIINHSEPIEHTEAREIIRKVFKHISFSKAELTQFFREFYAIGTMQFAMIPLDAKNKDDFNACHQALLSVLDSVDLQHHNQKMNYVKDLYCAFHLLLERNPVDCPVTVKEASDYMTQFIALITQKLMRSIDAWYMLKLLTDRHPNTRMLNFSLKSLRTVNLSIGTPVKEYTNTVREQTALSGTIFRYVHSDKPMMVNTGFMWLSIVLHEIKSPSELQHILSLIFNDDYRSKFIEISPEYKDIPFARSNPGPILMESWMITEGLDKFFTKLIDAFSLITLTELDKIFVGLFTRYINMNLDSLNLTFEEQRTCRVKFCVILTRAKRQNIFDTKTFDPPITYESLITRFLDKTFYTYYPQRLHLGVNATSAMLVAQSIKLFDEVIKIPPLSPEEHEKDMKNCLKLYTDFFTFMLDVAEENKDVEFAKELLSHLSGLKDVEKHAIHTKIMQMIRERLHKMKH